MKRLLAIVVLALLACSQAPATSVCATDSDVGEPAPKHWMKYRVSAEVAGTGEYLLGVDGERVLAGPALPEVRQQGAQAVLGKVWLNRVDWSAYQYTASGDQPGMSVYFDADKSGRRHLCRIENDEQAGLVYGNDEDGQGAPQFNPASTRVVEVEQFRYDSNSRLIAIERRGRDDAANGWQVRPASCFLHTDAGSVKALAEVPGGDCRSAIPADFHTSYVHDAEGRLVRKIFSEPQLEMVDGQYANVLHPVVQVFDTAGRLAAEYRETAERTPYRKAIVPATASSNIRDTWVMEDPPRNFVFTDNWNRDWTIVAVPAKEEVGYYAMELPELKTLAKGKTSKSGLVNIGKSGPAIRKALYQPDTVLAFYSEGQVFILTPPVSTEVWQRCQSVDASRRDVCP